MLYRACTQPGRLLAKHKKERVGWKHDSMTFPATVDRSSFVDFRNILFCFFFFPPCVSFELVCLLFLWDRGCKKENGVEPSNWNESSYGVSLYANIRMTKWVLERRRKHVNDGDFMKNKKKCAWQGQISHIVHLLLLLLLLMLWRWNVKPLACWCRED